MNELVNMVAQKTGLPQDKAKEAVQAVLDYLKQKLPAPVASQIDAVISGGAPNIGDAGKALGGMFGKK